MAQQTIANLKARFETGKKPNQGDYAALLDSYVHKSEVEGINAATMDERINNYDASLKEVTPGAIDTLGDVLQILSGFDTSEDVKTLLDAAGGAVSWGAVTGKPTSLAVAWSEQSISLDSYSPNSPYSYEGIQAISVVRGIGLLSPTKKALITDMFITNVPVLMQRTDSTPLLYIAHRIRSVTIAVDPKITLL